MDETLETATRLAYNWLRTNGYAQYQDGVWHHGGYVVEDIPTVLGEFLFDYLKEQHAQPTDTD